MWCFLQLKPVLLATGGQRNVGNVMLVVHLNAFFSQALKCSDWLHYPSLCVRVRGVLLCWLLIAESLDKDETVAVEGRGEGDERESMPKSSEIVKNSDWLSHVPVSEARLLFPSTDLARLSSASDFQYPLHRCCQVRADVPPGGPGSRRNLDSISSSHLKGTALLFARRQTCEKKPAAFSGLKFCPPLAGAPGALGPKKTKSAIRFPR